jgi:TonB-dependent SusC/RagA subfamily outer membrane receptor
MVFLLISCTSMLWAQGTQIKGKVTSTEDGSTLPGASVVVKGTNVAMVTDVDGNYIINVPQGATALMVSFVGFKTQEVQINGQTEIIVGLIPDVTGLDEVVVTALGITKEKKALGYSVQDLKGEELNQSRETNIVNALSGKIAGVQITGATGNMGGSSQIIIRGAHSVTGNNSPLFVVDGVPFDNSDYNSANTARGAGGYDYGNMAQDINPNDIESMSVLKGPQAASLYGSRASNGVIVITTKKGKMQKNKALGVTLNSSISWEQVAVLPKYQNQYGGGYSLTLHILMKMEIHLLHSI